MCSYKKTDFDVKVILVLVVILMCSYKKTDFDRISIATLITF